MTPPQSHKGTGQSDSWTVLNLQPEGGLGCEGNLASFLTLTARLFMFVVAVLYDDSVCLALFLHSLNRRD
ncbi:hypothetical protein AOLI_G00059900 [Acnodon oligacanthus]